MIRELSTVEFDPLNSEHVHSIKSMLDNGRRDSKLRFHLGAEEEDTGAFTSILSKALYLMAYQYMKNMEQQGKDSTHAQSNNPVSAGSTIYRLPGKHASSAVQPVKNGKQGDLVQPPSEPVIGLPGKISTMLTEQKKIH